MPKLRVLSGKDVIAIYRIFGFEPVKQSGSHVKLRRIARESRQTLTIPNHVELDQGTTRALYVQGLRFVPEEELRPHFYTV